MEAHAHMQTHYLRHVLNEGSSDLSTSEGAQADDATTLTGPQDSGPETSELVMGVGVGVFLLVFFGLLAYGYCLMGYYVWHKPCNACTCASVLYGVVVIYLFAAEKREETYRSYGREDHVAIWYARYIIFGFMTFFTVWCLWIYISETLQRRTVAQPEIDGVGDHSTPASKETAVPPQDTMSHRRSYL